MFYNNGFANNIEYCAHNFKLKIIFKTDLLSFFIDSNFNLGKSVTYLFVQI